MRAGLRLVRVLSALIVLQGLANAQTPLTNQDLVGTYDRQAAAAPGQFVVKAVPNRDGRFMLTDIAGDWEGLRLPDRPGPALTQALQSLLSVDGKLVAPLPDSFGKPGALVFTRLPKASEMSETIPDWARARVEKTLRWVIVLEPKRAMANGKPQIVLTGKFYRGKIAHSSVQDPDTGALRTREATVEGYGDENDPAFVVDVTYEKDACGPADTVDIRNGCIDFDWVMPARLTAGPDGVLRYFPPDGAQAINPPGWEVNLFDLIADGHGCDFSLRLVWTVEGNVVADGNTSLVRHDASWCTLTYRFPRLGKYPVKLEARDPNNDNLIASVTKDVLVEDWLIVSIGDSIASGEGNPDRPARTSFLTDAPNLRDPQWQNLQCHRSGLSGTARAALQIEQKDPRTSVTLIHLACSGATVPAGLTGPYAGAEAATLLQPQLQVLAQLVPGREIDALLVSVGANDVGFADIVTGCVLQFDCTDPNGPDSMAFHFGRRAAQLPERYASLNSRIKEFLPKLPAARIYITEYLDPMRNDDGALCEDSMLIDHALVRSSPRPTLPILTITAREVRWVVETLLPRLNREVSEAAQRFGWVHIGGIAAAFRNHGYCAKDHWVVRFEESQEALSDVVSLPVGDDLLPFLGRYAADTKGTLHPNRYGHRVYQEKIGARLEADLYIGGDLSKPRPRQETGE